MSDGLGMPSAVDGLQEPEPVDETRYVPPSRDWSDTHALSVVVEDYDLASQYRFQNHDWRWQSADQLYCGWVSPRYWEGTKIQRSSVGVFLSFETVESMIPRIKQALFGDDPWFEADPLRGTTSEAARTVRDLLVSQFEEINLPEQIRRVVKSGLIYGNGILKLCWEYSKGKKKQYLPVFIPEMKSINLGGMQRKIPSGYKRKIREVEVDDITNRPNVSYVPLKWFYIDPNCLSPNCQDARYVIERCMWTVDEVDAMRDEEGWTIPQKMVLMFLSASRPHDSSDWTMASTEVARTGTWSPTIDQTSDPAGKRIEVLYYWTKDRLTVVLNRKLVVYNKPNPYGFIPYYNFPYADMLDRFYAMAVTDVTESEQKLQQQIINARIDELALLIHPPTVVKRGHMQPVYKLRMRPGALVEAEDPSKDVIRQYPQNVTQQAYLEVSASESRAQRATGVTDFAMLGGPGGPNPALRTATGAAAQQQASFSRMQYLVEMIESFVLEPMIRDTLKLDKMYLDPEQIAEVIGPNGKPESIFGANVRIAIRAGSRMQSKQGLLQALPLLMNSVLNPVLMEHLETQGITVDVTELMQMIVEATGYKRKSASLFRPMTQQEQQALAQKRQMALAPQMMKMQMQDKRMDKLHDMQIDKGDLEMLKEVVRGAIDRANTESAGDQSQGDNSKGSQG